MSQKIPKEILQDLLKQSSDGTIDASQCAVWLPLVCEYTLELLEDQELRERIMKLIEKIDTYRRDRGE